MFSDFELAEKALRNQPGATAREVALFVTEMGSKWDRGQANSVLYKMLNQGLVKKELVDGPRPHWWSLETAIEIKQKNELTKLKINNKKSKNNDFIPLKQIPEYQNNIQGINLQFAVSNEMSISDPYINCDWLDKRIFVTINSQHPYIKNNISSDKILNEFLVYLSIDAYLEWRMIMEIESKSTFDSIKIKDRILREKANT